MLESYLSPFQCLIGFSHARKSYDVYTTIQQTHKSTNERDQGTIARDRIRTRSFNLQKCQNGSGRFSSSVIIPDEWI